MKSKKKISVLNSIHELNQELLKELYEQCYPRVEKMVLKYGGDKSSAKDIFQDAMLIVYRKVRENDLILTCKLSTYVYSICKNLCIQQNRKEKNYINLPEQSFEMVSDSETTDLSENRMYALIDKHFKDLSENCQKILTLHFEGKKIADIMKELSYDNAQYAMDRKYRCKASLIKRIINDPEYKKIKNEINAESHPLPGRDV